MSSKNSTANTLKTTGRAVQGLAKGTAKTTEFTVVHWRGLLPLLCIGAAGVYAVAAELFAWVYGPRAWFWSVLVGLILFVWIDGWVGSLPRRVRPPAIAFVLFTIAAATAFILAANRIETYLTVGVTALVLGTWWWNGSAYQSHKTTERSRRRMENTLAKLGLSDGTRVTGVDVADNGDVEWRLYLGDKDRITQLKSDEIAHMLKVDVSRVLVRRTEKGTTRNVKIVLLAAALRKAKSVVHPAVESPTGDWAPGARTIAQGAPIGPQMASADQISHVHSYRTGFGALHKNVAGTTGSGKSVTVRSMGAHVIASNDAVLAGVDLVKGGATLLPFHQGKAMANLLYLPANKATDEAAFLEAARQLLAELVWLRSEVAVRTALMAEGTVLGADGELTDVWPASPEHPVIEYVFEEYAATMGKIADLDPDLAEQIDIALNGIGQTARSSGISLTIVTQRPTVDEIPASLRGNLNQTILHKLNSSNDQGRLWSQYDVDALSLPLGSGLVYIEAPEGGNPALTKAYDLSKPKDCLTLAKTYADSQPAIDWMGARTLPGDATDDAEARTAAAAALEDSEAVGGALGLLRDAAEDDDLPAGLGIIGGLAELEDGDDERLAVILEALQAAPKPLSRTQIEAVLAAAARNAGQTVDTSAKAVAASKTTALRLLTILQDQGKVVREGNGRASRYRIDTTALTGAAA